MQYNNPIESAEAPFPENEDERVRELESYDIPYSLREDEFDALARLAARLMGTPVSQINFMDTDTQFTKSSFGEPVEKMPRSQSVCQYTILSDNILEINDLREDPRVSEKPYVTGDPYFRYYAGVPLLTDRGHAIGTLCVFDCKPRDISESLKQDLRALADEVMARLNLRKQEKALDKMNRFKDRLMKLVSHDIRNPLTGIFGAAEFMVESGISQEERTELAQIINESAGQIQNIVSEMLDSELVDYRKLKCNPHRYKVSTGLKEIVNLFAFISRKKHITLTYEVEGEIPPVMIDGQYYERIMANLLSNAVKFTPRDGEVRIRCRYRRTDSGDNRLMTTVEDSGIGMSQKQVHQIFNEVNTTGRSGTDNEGSYGMGLYIVKKLCEACNAEIRVTSEPDRGTTFTIEMPAPPA